MVNPQSETNIPIKLDLDNPIFVFYLNMRGITITRVNQILESGHVKSQNNRRERMRRCMNVSEAKSVCQDRVVWRFV